MLQNMDLEAAGLELRYLFRGENDTRVYNPSTGAFPAILSADGNINLLNQLGNYVRVVTNCICTCTVRTSLVAVCNVAKHTIQQCSTLQAALHTRAPSLPQLKILTCARHVATTNLSAQVPLAWTPDQGCISCREGRICLDTAAATPARPTVYVGMTIEPASPFLPLFLKRFHSLDYPKGQMHLSISVVLGKTGVSTYTDVIEKWAAAVKREYASVTVTNVVTRARGASTDAFILNRLQEDLAQSVGTGSSYYMRVSSVVMFNNTQSLAHLIQANRSFVGPVMAREGKLFSTFWGGASGDINAVCSDDDRRCESWANIGYCKEGHEYEKWMQGNCAKSCGKCTPSVSKHVSCCSCCGCPRI